MSPLKPRILLLLRTIKGIEKGKTLPDRWKLQKSAFLAEIEMQKKKVKGFEYEFIKDKDGPLARQIYDDMDTLMKLGFAEREYDPRLTEEGEEFLDMIEPLFSMNNEVIAPLNQVLDYVSDLSGKELRELTHKMEIEINGKNILIDDLLPYSVILKSLPEREYESRFQVPEGWQKTIEIWIDREVRNDFLNMFEGLSRSDILTLESVMK